MILQMVFQFILKVYCPDTGTTEKNLGPSSSLLRLP